MVRIQLFSTIKIQLLRFKWDEGVVKKLSNNLVFLSAHKNDFTKLPFNNQFFKNCTKKIISTWIKKFIDLFFTYQLIFLQPLILGNINFKVSSNNLIYNLYFHFKKNKFIVTLNYLRSKENLLCLTPGLLIKGFEYKKSIKKNITLKFLLVRFLRKIIVTLRLKHLKILVRGVPVKLSKLMYFFLKPITHKYLTPDNFKNNNWAEENSYLKIHSLTFIKIFNTQNKIKKKGRIKRKIQRKVFLKNNVID